MAIIQFSGLVTDITGKIGGGVLQGSSYGTIIRNNAYGRRSNTYRIKNQQAKFFNTTNFGQHLTSIQKEQKAYYGALITRPTKLNPNTPYNWWSFNNAFNGKLLAIGFPMITGGFLAPAMTSNAGLTVTQIAGTTNFLLTITNTLTATERTIIRVGPAVLPTRSYRNSTLKQVAVGSGSTNSWIITQQQIADIFGICNLADNRYFSLQIVNTNTGYFTTIVNDFI